MQPARHPAGANTVGSCLSVPHPWLLAFGVTTLLLALGVTSGLVNSKLWVSEPLVCALFGVVLGPFGSALLLLDPAANPQAHVFLREAARVTLAIAVLAAALRLPRGWLGRHWRGLAVALGPGMLLMWAAGAAVAFGCLGLPPLVCVLVGAVVAPTDPVLSAPVVSGDLARRAVPDDLRHAITAESGINDGLAGPFVMGSVALLAGTESAGQTVGGWLLHAVLWEVGSAVAAGSAAGRAASGLLLRPFMPWARRLPETLFAGWFGPIGAAALFYALQAQDLTGQGDLWPVASLAAMASVVAHGLTGTHLSAWLGTRLGQQAAP